MEKKVVAHLHNLRRLPKKIRSFFQLPMTRYAAEWLQVHKSMNP